MRLNVLRTLVLTLLLMTGYQGGHFAEAASSDQTPPSAARTAGPAQSPFLDNGNGTVTDKTSGLMWKKCSEGQTWRKAGNRCEGEAAGYSWDDALNNVEIMNTRSGTAGFKDWRLPTIKELATLVDYERETPIDLEMFPATPALWYWSSTPFHRFPKRAWFVAFGYGDISTERIDNQGLHVRLVRGGRK